jgi:hypothetical protein
MLEAVPHKGAIAGAFAATAVAGAAGAVWAAARVARWAARLAPEHHDVPEFEADDAPRVVVPLVKPTGGQHAHPTSHHDVGDAMQQMHGAVKA